MLSGSQAGVLIGACLVIGFIVGYMFGRVPPPGASPWGNA